jgi:hypothetical protein
MNGAHCLDCREAGPDLVITDPVLPVGTEARVSFTCGACGRRWTWIVTMRADGTLVYAVAS